MRAGDAHIDWSPGLRALRTEHGVSIQAVRSALTFAEEELQIDRLLLREELRASAGELLLERYGELVNLSRSGQLAMRKLLDVYLARVEWAESFPVRLYPFVSGDISDRRPVAIDPGIAFGRPVLVRASIATAIIAERIDAGESVNAVAFDYELTPEDVEEAVLYEHAA